MFESSGDILTDLSALGASANDDRRRVRFFRITGGSNPYSAELVSLAESDGARRDPANKFAIDQSQKLLWELNGLGTVAPGTVVVAEPNPAGAGFAFVAPVVPADRRVSRCLVRATYGGPVMGEREVYEEAARPGWTYCVDVPTCPSCDSDYGYSPPPPPPPPGDMTVTVVRTGGPPPDVTFTPDVVDSAGTHHTPGASVGTVTVGGLPGGSGYAVLSSIAGGPWGTPSWTFYPAVGSGPSGTGTVGAFTVSGSGGVLVFTVPPA